MTTSDIQGRARMRLRHQWGAGLVCVTSMVTLAIAAGAVGPAPSVAQEAVRVNVTTDKATLLVVPREPFTKVIVANPAIADVQVINPNQLLITGKASGVTSLVLFRGPRIEFYDVAVNPTPLGRSGTPPAGAATHAVIVQRADKLSENLFLLDRDQSWIELGASRVDAPEVTKK